MCKALRFSADWLDLCPFRKDQLLLLICYTSTCKHLLFVTSSFVQVPTNRHVSSYSYCLLPINTLCSRSSGPTHPIYNRRMYAVTHFASHTSTDTHQKTTDRQTERKSRHWELEQSIHTQTNYQHIYSSSLFFFLFLVIVLISLCSSSSL